MKKLSLLFVVGAAGTAHANAFLLGEFDSKAVGRGNASAATDTDPSSIHYNVGGVAAGEGTRFMIGAALIQPVASYTDPQGNKTDSDTGLQAVPHVFFTTKINKMFGAGIGFYTPFGLAVSWPVGAPQGDVIHKAALRTFFITPSVGANLESVVPGLSVGAGIDLVPATVELEQDIYLGQDRGTARLGGDAFGVGARVGVMFTPKSLGQLSLGAMWRSDVKEDFEGTGDFDAPPPYRSMVPPDGPVHTSITMPQQIVVGAAFRPAPKIELEANVSWVNWKKFKELNIEVPAEGSGTMTIHQEQAYEDKVTLRVGGEYRVNPKLAVRAGYIYDPTPVPAEHLTAQLPDVDRHDVTAGASYALGNYDIHAGLLFVLPTSRKASETDPFTPAYKGTYDVSAWVASLTFAGKIGK